MTAARLVRPELGPIGRHRSGALTVGALVVLAVLGLFSPPIALLAAGAGAGYSLSGSV